MTSSQAQPCLCSGMAVLRSCQLPLQVCCGALLGAEALGQPAAGVLRLGQLRPDPPVHLLHRQAAHLCSRSLHHLQQALAGQDTAAAAGVLDAHGASSGRQKGTDAAAQAC